MNNINPPQNASDEETIDFGELKRRLGRGVLQCAALAILGAVVVGAFFAVASRIEPTTTSARVVFSFDGVEHNQYPDGSKFQAEDLRSPEIIQEALRRLDIDSSVDMQSKIRGALTIEGLIPSGVARERDRLRASGQTPPLFVADEYSLNLTLKRTFPLSITQREALVNEIVSAYRRKFQQTYVETPLAFGNAFAGLRDSDYSEYELILDQETQNILAFLNQQLSASKSRSFRSRTTNLSYADLIKQTQLFSQLKANQILGLIYSVGLTKDRASALSKLDFHIHSVEFQEQELLESAKTVADLLQKAQDRSQNYVLGIKSQGASGRNDSVVIDQNLVDSLLTNDAYNFLVRSSLEANLKAVKIQAEKKRLQAQRERVAQFTNSSSETQKETISRLGPMLGDLEKEYRDLVSNIRRTHEEFTRQQLADAITLSGEITTPGTLGRLCLFSALGLLGGLAGGVGLSMLNIYIDRRQ